ncbi:MAG: CHRD domain-containing protein [Rhodobacteraceae bacterium]|nr:CHRD domain-containing protein [Paracoccaceae bacterium]
MTVESQLLPKFAVGRALACALLAAALPVFAIVPSANAASDLCGYFSPDPNDTAGPPIAFFADLSADEESAVTESPGTGRVDFVLDRDTLRLTWKVAFRDLTSEAIGLHIHGPQTPGGEGGILIDLAPNGVRSGIEGETTLNDGLLAYLVQDRMYVNLHTQKYKIGELRGQIRKQRPQC